MNRVEQDKQLKNALRSFVKEYATAKFLTDDLIEHVWQGMWGEIGQAVAFKYQVPRCDRGLAELTRLPKEKKAVLLLPDDIYTPEGLVRLGKAFPLLRSRITDPKVAVKVSHRAGSGCVDIEMSLDAPYRTSEGYNEWELAKRITADCRQGMRLPTYLVGSEFSQLLTGQHFDIADGLSTGSRLAGSFYKGNMLAACYDGDGRVRMRNCGIFSVMWLPSDRSRFIGGRSEGVKRA